MPLNGRAAGGVLRKVRVPGHFFTAGCADLRLPLPEVEGVGRIALPLLPEHAERLVALAGQAPFGRGAQTLVDTEKAPGMFATLVLALPSDPEGGELVLHHRGQDLRADDPAQAAFAAFYADGVHQVLPVRSGYRLVRVFNLVRQARGKLPTAPDHGAEQPALTTLLAAWAAAEDAPSKLVSPLGDA